MRLEPLQLRILVNTAAYWVNVPEEGRRERTAPQDAEYATKGVTTTSTIAQKLGVDTSSAESAIQGLAASAFVQEANSRTANTDRGVGGVRLPVPPLPVRGEVAPWGPSALKVVFPQLRGRSGLRASRQGSNDWRRADWPGRRWATCGQHQVRRQPTSTVDGRVSGHR